MAAVPFDRVHPIERLRMVARAAGEGPALLAQEAAGALAAFSDDPAGLVTACRRLVGRQPAVGPMWWLAARVLTSGEPGLEAWRAADDLHGDRTPQALAACLPDTSTVLVLGWPEQVAEALERRGDVDALVVDVAGEGHALARRLRRGGADPTLVLESGLGAAAGWCDLVLLEAAALGTDGFVAVSGSRAAAAVARHVGVPVWAAAGVGRVLPERLWRSLTRHMEDDEPWEAPEELVPLDLVDKVVGPEGPVDAADAPRRADCPVTPELTKELR